jgi:TRAP-type C4-dicarboxylate transport system permease small subunit
MNALKVVALALIVLGALALAYGGFSYTSETHYADIGPLHMSVAEKERVNVPLWAGVAAIIAGGLMLVVGKRL